MLLDNLNKNSSLQALRIKLSQKRTNLGWVFGLNFKSLLFLWFFVWLD